MICPKCGAYERKIIDSRDRAKSNAKYRRCECLECGHRYTTFEIPEKQLYEMAEKLFASKLKKSISDKLSQVVDEELSEKKGGDWW